MKRVPTATTFVGISELRTQADAIIQVARKERVVLEKRHKPVAVLVPIEQYDRTEETLNFLEDHLLGLLAKEREQRSPRRNTLTLEELERKVGLRHA